MRQCQTDPAASLAGLASRGEDFVSLIKKKTVSVAILFFVLQMPTLANAVTWPIERRHFEDNNAGRELEPEPDSPGEIWADPLVGIGFVRLPPGCFDMGNEAVGFVGPVCVDGFFLSRYEITNAQFRRFRSAHDSGLNAGYSLDSDDQPVVNVSWQDAMAFANWLGEETGTSFRLATEAEWEYACGYGWKEGATEKAGAFGNLRESSDDSGADGTVAVGSYQVGPQGIYDMHGNASEWVLDAYVDDVDRYGETRDDPRIDIETTPLRVRRGGSWTSSTTQSHCSARDYYLGDLAVPHTGFRLVAEPQE